MTGHDGSSFSIDGCILIGRRRVFAKAFFSKKTFAAYGMNIAICGIACQICK
jgi:hypothetical protein